MNVKVEASGVRLEVERMTEELNQRLLQDETIGALLEKLKGELGAGTEVRLGIDAKRGWEIRLIYPDRMTGGYAGTLEWLFSRTEYERKKQADEKCRMVVREYFGDDPAPRSCSCTYEIFLSIQDIVAKEPPGKIAALVMVRYGQRVEEIKQLSRRIVCPYAGVCSEENPVDADDEFQRKGCAACVQDCTHLAEHRGKHGNRFVWVFPGSYVPPTEGHVALALRALEICGRLIVLCSSNPSKAGEIIFTPQECKEFWQTYELPEGVRVMTYDELEQSGIDFRQVVMVRGVRDDRDFEYEKEIMMDNAKKLGIDKFFLLVSGEEHKGTSSTLARQLAAQGKKEELEKIVSPQVAEALLERMKGGEG
jgi:pantetheine-phosphate adenylyltransferase